MYDHDSERLEQDTNLRRSVWILTMVRFSDLKDYCSRKFRRHLPFRSRQSYRGKGLKNVVKKEVQSINYSARTRYFFITQKGYFFEGYFGTIRTGLRPLLTHTNFRRAGTGFREILDFDPRTRAWNPAPRAGFQDHSLSGRTRKISGRTSQKFSGPIFEF